MKKTLSTRERARRMAKCPSAAKVKAVFYPMEQLLRDLKSGEYQRTERGTPVVENVDGTVTPTLIAFKQWFDYWKYLSVRVGDKTDFTAVDNFELALTRGMSYIKPPMYDEVREVLSRLKILYRQVPLCVSDEYLIDFQISDAMDDRHPLERYPQFTKEVHYEK